jgi:serine/threonine protein kinase
MFQLSRLEQDYQLVQVLGRGNFSEVGLYTSRLSQEPFAIKQTRANRMSINEVQALGSLWALVEQSPHVVRYFHSWVEEGQLFLVMEYCEDSLAKMIARQRAARRPFDEKTVKRILRAALQGLTCLHKCGILHLDLKPDNMLLQADTLKIADFGLSRAARVRSGDVEEGDSRYLAREVLNYSPQVDLAKADIFSLAMTLFEMLTLEPLPNNGPEWLATRDHGLRLADRMDLTAYSKDLLELVERMGARDWFARPSAFECLHAGYLKESARVSHLLAGNARSSKKRDSSL